MVIPTSSSLKSSLKMARTVSVPARLLEFHGIGPEGPITRILHLLKKITSNRYGSSRCFKPKPRMNSHK